MTLKLAYNTTDAPVLVDEQGYFIGGRSWGVVDTADQIGKAELDARRVVEADEDALAASDNVDAQAAVQALASRRERREAAEALPKDELIELAGEAAEALPEGGDGKPSKDDLVDEVVASGDPIPEASKKTTTRRRSSAAN